MEQEAVSSSLIEFKTQWWFEQGRGAGEACRTVWERELLPRMSPPIGRYLEIGVCEGHSMRWVLENLQPQIAVGIDPYISKPRERGVAEQHKANMQQNLAAWIEIGQCIIIQHKSQDVLREHYDLIPDDAFDLIFVDGTHEGLAAATDMFLCWPKLKLGGIMIMDDYDRRWYLGRPHTKEAIDAFLDAAESKYDWLWGSTRKIWNCQVGVQKIRN